MCRWAQSLVFTSLKCHIFYNGPSINSHRNLWSALVKGAEQSSAPFHIHHKHQLIQYAESNMYRIVLHMETVAWLVNQGSRFVPPSILSIHPHVHVPKRIPESDKDPMPSLWFSKVKRLFHNRSFSIKESSFYLHILCHIDIRLPPVDTKRAFSSNVINFKLVNLKETYVNNVNFTQNQSVVF